MNYDTASAPAGGAAGHSVGGGIAFLALMIVCACIAAPVMIRARRRLRRRYQETAVAGTRFQTNGHDRTPAAIWQADPGFDLEAFLRRAETTFWLVQRACEVGQTQRCRAYLAPGLYQELVSMTQQRVDTPAHSMWAWGKALLDDQKLGVSIRLANAGGQSRGRPGTRRVGENLRLLDVRQVEERQPRGHRPERETFAVQFHAAFTTRSVGGRGGWLARERVHQFTESWLFSRSAGARTIGSGDIAVAAGDWTVTSFLAFPPHRSNTGPGPYIGP